MTRIENTVQVRNAVNYLSLTTEEMEARITENERLCAVLRAETWALRQEIANRAAAEIEKQLHAERIARKEAKKHKGAAKDE